MKKFKSIIALVLAAANLAVFGACTKRTATETLAQPADPAAAVTAEPTKPLAEKTFQDVYGYQLEAFLGRQYYFEGEPVPIAETNYYFIDSYLTLNQYATYYGYPTLEGGFVDLSAAMTTTAEEGGEVQTYGNFLIEYAERVIESTLIVNKRAREEGVTLSQESMDQINTMIDSFNTQFAIPENISLDQLFHLYYSDACGEAEFRQIMEDYYLAETYTTGYVDTYEIPEDQLYYQNVRYALYSAPEMTATQEELESQEALANALLEECDGNVDTFDLLGNTRQNTGEVTEYGEITVAKDQTVPAFDEWVFDPTREEGEMTVIYAPEYGYFVVGYMGKQEIDYSARQQIAVTALGDEVTAAIDNGQYQFYTNDALGHVPTATEIEDIKNKSDVTRTVLIILLIVGVVMLGVAVFLLIRSRKKAAEGGNKGNDSQKKSSKPKKKPVVQESEDDDDDEEYEDEEDDEDGEEA